MAQVFISYAREDQDFAEVVQAKLERAGHRTSLDLDLLRAGDDWGDKLDLALRGAHALVLVLTPDARRSEYVAYEWAFALGAGLRLIVLDLVTTERHPRLEVLQRLDFTNKARPWETLLAEVARAEAARATEVDGDPGVPAAVKQALRALDSLDPQQRQEGVQTLANAEGDAARTALVRALQHPLKDVRAAAAKVFPDRADPRIVRGLIEAEEMTWDGVSFGLFFREVAPMGAAALPALLALVGERAGAREPIRTALLDALGRTHDAAAVPPLVSAMHDPSPNVRAIAASALADVGGAGAVAALRAALGDEIAGVREEAAKGVGRLGDVAAVPALTAILAGDVAAVRLPAARALGRLGDAGALPALRAALDDKDDDVRIAAAESLARLGDAAGKTYLEARIGEGGDVYDRDATVMRALVELDDTAAFPRIEQRLLGFESGSMPMHAIRALARTPSGVALLGRVLSGASKSSLARAIAEVLEPVETPEAREAVRQWRLRS